MPKSKNAINPFPTTKMQSKMVNEQQSTRMVPDLRRWL
jgi:hypothetical protein